MSARLLSSHVQLPSSLPPVLPVGPYSQLGLLDGTEWDALKEGFARISTTPDPALIAAAKQKGYKRGYQTAADVANQQLIEDSKSGWAVFDFDPSRGGVGFGRTLSATELVTKYAAEMRAAGLPGTNFHHKYNSRIDRQGFPLTAYEKANKSNQPIAIPLDRAPSLLYDIGPVRIANVEKLRNVLNANRAIVNPKTGILVKRY